MKLQKDVERIKVAGSELVGIALSIEALKRHFYARLEEHSRGPEPAIKVNLDEYRDFCTVDVARIEKLLQAEMVYREEQLQQQAQFDDFI